MYRFYASLAVKSTNKWHQQFTTFLDNSGIIQGSASHVPHYSRELGEKGGVEEVKVLPKRYETNVYSLVESGQIPSSEEVGPRRKFLKCHVYVFLSEENKWRCNKHYVHSTCVCCDAGCICKFSIFSFMYRKHCLLQNEKLGITEHSVQKLYPK